MLVQQLGVFIPSNSAMISQMTFVCCYRKGQITNQPTPLSQWSAGAQCICGFPKSGGQQHMCSSITSNYGPESLVWCWMQYPMQDNRICRQTSWVR